MQGLASMKQLVAMAVLVGMMMTWSSSVLMGCDAQVDVQQCQADADNLLNECQSNDEARCCAAFGTLLNADSGCVCQAVANGDLDPSLVTQAATLCKVTIPSSVSTCLNAGGAPPGTPSTSTPSTSNFAGKSLKTNWIGMLLVSIGGLALMI